MADAVNEIVCSTWNGLLENMRAREGELDSSNGVIWFRGCRDCGYELTPSLMRATATLSRADHDQFEQDAFFEFQARSVELRRQGLTDWEYIFYARHFGLPTRVLDWTDTFGTALYFAVENWDENANIEPAIWMLNPYSLNEETWGKREIILPKYLGLDDDGDFWDYGELLTASGPWGWDGPVAVFPIQINDRVRAQRGWFTIHGDDRHPIDHQYPGQVTKLIMTRDCIPPAKEFLKLAGLNRFAIYPDLENLSVWIAGERAGWAEGRRKKPKTRARGKSA